MKKGRYTEEQIAYALRQVELGTPVVEVVRHVTWQVCWMWDFCSETVKLHGRAKAELQHGGPFYSLVEARRNARPRVAAPGVMYSVGEAQLQLWGWEWARCVVVAREEIQEDKRPLCGRLFEFQGYKFQV